MHCTQSVTTENHRIMATLEALVITTLLTLGSSGVHGNDGELSTTTGDTVLIPCDFGEGTVQNLYWYYNNGTGQVKILTFFKGNVSVDAAYAHRASLHDDSSTLILTDIGVKDEGTYRCDVDREGQTGVPNINTNLYVFSLTSHNLPEIAQCTEVASKSSVCSVYTNKSITMNCALSKVYPAKDAELVWYRDEQRVHSTDNSKENDDGTVDITAETEVSESGNLTCNATFLTAQGAESTASSVAVWITPVPDAPNTPEKGLSKGGIAGIAVGLVVFVVACPLIIIISLRNRKGNKSRSGGQEYALVKNTDETGRTSKNLRTDLVTEGDLESLSHKFPHNGYNKICRALDCDYNTSEQILSKHNNDYQKALMDVFMAWKNRAGGPRKELVAALRAAEVGGLVYLIPETTSQESKEAATSCTTTATTSTTMSTSLPKTEATTMATAAITTSSTSPPKEECTPGKNGSKKDFQDILEEVARKVRMNSEINTLGRKLGFEPEDIDAYITTNHKTQHITSDGTLQMLRDWRKLQKKSTERSALKTALVQAGQIHLADDLFPSSH